MTFLVVSLALLLCWFFWRHEPRRSSGSQTKSVGEILESTIGTVETGLDRSDLPDLSHPDLQNVRYYVKDLPAAQEANGKQIIADALSSWEELTDMRATKASSEEDATVVLELGPHPFVSAQNDGGPSGVWRIQFSNREHYDPARLKAAACHAFGRVLGLGYSDNPADVMFDYDRNPTARRALKPTPADIREFRKRFSR